MTSLARIAAAAAFIGCLSGVGSFSSGAAEEISWKDVEGVKIPVPPSYRPRLYLRPEHVGELSARRDHPALAPVVEQLRNLARRREQFKLEWDALEYLIHGDRTLGRETVERALALT